MYFIKLFRVIKPIGLSKFCQINTNYNSQKQKSKLNN